MICNTEISVQCTYWNFYNKQINKHNINILLQTVIRRYNVFRLAKQVDLSILLTNDQEIQKLNLQFRGVNKATNVLSFPEKYSYWKNINLTWNKDKKIYLGDIAFAYDSISKESQILSKNFFAHFKHLLVHSTLHLIGYDHNDEIEATLMEYLEREILTEILEQNILFD